MNAQNARALKDQLHIETEKGINFIKEIFIHKKDYKKIIF